MARYVLLHPEAGIVADFDCDERDLTFEVYRVDGPLGDRLPLRINTAGGNPEAVQAVVTDCEYECTLTP